MGIPSHIDNASDGVTNFFVHRSAAQRYAMGRPYFHPVVVARIAAFTKSHRFDRALDVGCGTGLSTQALIEIADTVDAIDISPDMLAEAKPHERVHYQVAPAEQLPFADASFDLVTVGVAFHWFDQAAFLAEARRVLKSDGWLVIYMSCFLGEMAENPQFEPWANQIYHSRFPTPPRRAFGVSAQFVEPYGFVLAGKEEFAHDHLMSAEELTAFLITQTNVIAAVENGAMPLQEAIAWITAGASPFFAGQRRTMKFSGTIWYLRAATDQG